MLDDAFISRVSGDEPWRTSQTEGAFTPHVGMNRQGGVSCRQEPLYLTIRGDEPMSILDKDQRPTLPHRCGDEPCGTT